MSGAQPPSCRLVFLHIPKAAGTAQIGALVNLYGRNSVHWHARDEDANLHNEQIRVLAGHRPISFYQDTPLANSLYLAILRHPVSRVLSYYSHCVRPDLAGDDSARELRLRDRQRWLGFGADPNSIVNTIRRCGKFRQEITNTQCRYLSAGSACCGEAIRTMRAHNCVVGLFENLDHYLNQVMELLHWTNLQIREINRSREASHDEILREPGAAELIKELVAEDQKLYDFVRRQQRGVFVNLPERASIQEALAVPAVTDLSDPRSPHWAHVHLYSKGILRVEPERPTTARVVIANESPLVLGVGTAGALSLSYQLKDEQGGVLDCGAEPSALRRAIPPGEKAVVDLPVFVPENLFDRASMLEVDLIIRGGKPLRGEFPLHACWITLIKNGLSTVGGKESH